MRPWILCALVMSFPLLGCKPAIEARDTHESRPIPPAAPPASHLPQNLTPRLEAIFASQPAKSKAIYGCRIIDADTGKEIYSHNADLPVSPASNMKIFTAATALDEFGPDEKLKTTLAYDGKNLWIIGGGDPATGDPDMAKAAHHSRTMMFDEWAKVLRDKGLTHIAGNIYYNDRMFDHELISPAWGRENLGEWYAAPVSALNFNDNCVDITLSPTKTGDPMRPVISPPVTDVKLINHTKTQAKNTADVSRKGMADIYELTGGAPHKVDLDSKPVVNPAAFFADAMRTNFASHDIHISGSILPGPEAFQGLMETIAVHETKLADAIKRMDKDSQNLFAEVFCKRVGWWYAEHRLHESRSGSWALGAQAVGAFLSGHHIDTKDFHMVDGSGLSSQNHVTARQVTGLLAVMLQHPAHQAFFDSLPISGVDGTIKKRMKDVAGKVHAKTGFIGGVRSLSGYIQTNSGHTLIFSIIYNHIPGSVKPYEVIQDRVCEELVRND
jgi:D-alanyl-D-alanine carboxypeptidase/D-alanyl-D-alanine-endopeptidase (penicillin-binding protein 4)